MNNYKNRAIKLAVWAGICIFVGAILLIVGLHVNFVNNNAIFDVNANWSNATPYSIYNLPPMFSSLPSKAQALAIVGIIGSLFMYAALILLGFLIWNIVQFYTNKDKK